MRQDGTWRRSATDAERIGTRVDYPQGRELPEQDPERFKAGVQPPSSRHVLNFPNKAADPPKSATHCTPPSISRPDRCGRQPASTEEVAAVRVRLCAQHGMKIVAQGGNTGICGAARPRDADRNVVSRLDRMRKIRGQPAGEYNHVGGRLHLAGGARGGCVRGPLFSTLTPMSEERSFCAMRPATSFSESKRSCAAATRRVAGLKGRQGRSWPT